MLGGSYYQGLRYPLTLGAEYLVVALSFLRESVWGTGCVVEVYSPETDGLVVAPLLLFEITDASASKYWSVTVDELGEVFVAPSLVRTDYFHDDLSERLPETRRAFLSLLEDLEAEAGNANDVPGEH